MNINPFPIEEITNGEHLFRYFSPKALPKDQSEIPLSIFNDYEMSCDWEKYQNNPFESFHISEGLSCVVRITVCDDIRNPKNPKRIGELVPAWHQEVLHDPVWDDGNPKHGPNRAHAMIVGLKRIAVQETIRNNSSLVFMS